MALRIGDSVFLPNATPGVLVSENKEHDSVEVLADKAAVRKAHRHGYINGLNQDLRLEFDKILDEVKGLDKKKAPKQRIEELQSRIDELRLDPRNMVLTRYLTAEMAHIMNMSGEKPQTFEIDTFKLR